MNAPLARVRQMELSLNVGVQFGLFAPRRK